MPRAIKRFLAKHPEATFAYRTGLIRDMPMELLGKVADFGLSIWPLDHPNLNCERLFGGKICLIVPRGHALARFDVVPLSALKDVPLILYQQDMPMGALIRQSLSDAGVSALPVVEINRSEQACSLVHQGLGVALVNRYSVDEDIWRNVLVKDVDLEIPVSVYLVTSRFEGLDAAGQAFVDILRSDYDS